MGYVNSNPSGTYAPTAVYRFDGTSWQQLSAVYVGGGPSFTKIAGKLTGVKVTGPLVVQSPNPPVETFTASPIGGWYDPSGPKYSYNWTVSPGLSIVSGQGTNSVIVKYGQQYVQLTVTCQITEAGTGTVASGSINTSWETRS